MAHTIYLWAHLHSNILCQQKLEVCYGEEWLSHRAYKRLNKHQTFEQTELGLVFSILRSDL